jgi:hypothetical protein
LPKGNTNSIFLKKKSFFVPKTSSQFFLIKCFLGGCVITNVFLFYFFQFCGFEILVIFPKKESSFFCQVYTKRKQNFPICFVAQVAKIRPQNKLPALITCLSIGYTINGHVQNYSQLIQKYYAFLFSLSTLKPIHNECCPDIF